MQFFLDSNGRVPFGGEVDFNFRSAPAALATALSCPETLASAIKDCQVIYGVWTWLIHSDLRGSG